MSTKQKPATTSFRPTDESWEILERARLAGISTGSLLNDAIRKCVPKLLEERALAISGRVQQVNSASPKTSAGYAVNAAASKALKKAKPE